MPHIYMANMCILSSAIVDDTMAFNSTALYEIATHKQKPPGWTEWGIASAEGCVHQNHIDTEGSGMLTVVHEGGKVFLMGTPINPTLFSINPVHHHSMDGVLEELVHEAVLLLEGFQMSVCTFQWLLDHLLMGASSGSNIQITTTWF